MNNEPKQVLVVRKDLNMRKGKIAAQCAHASMTAILNIGLVKDNQLIIDITDPALQAWLVGRFTKVCVFVESEQELIDIYQKALDANIKCCSLIIDSGLTEFNNVPTKTVVAVGPDYPINIDSITGHLKLL